MDATAIPVADANSVVLAPTLEGMSFELLGGVGHKHPRSTEHRPPVLDVARGQPCLLWTHGLREAERDRQRRRLLKGEAEAENAARRHVGNDRKICAADEGSATVDDLNEVDVGGRVIDLADIQRVRGMDVTRPRLEPLKMLRVR